MQIRFREFSITPRCKSEYRHEDPEYPCRDKYDCDSAIIRHAPPVSDDIIHPARSYPRHHEEFCEWTDHKCCERRGYILEGLSEAKDSTLTLEWNNLLQYGLLTGFSDRPNNHPEEKSDPHEPDRRDEWEKEADQPTEEIRDEEWSYGISPQSVPCDIRSADDETDTRHREDDPPEFDRDDRESIGVHECHEDSAEEVIPHREKYHRKESRNPCDHADRSTDIDIFLFIFLLIEMILVREGEGEEMDDHESHWYYPYPDRPIHPESPDDETWKYRYNREGESIHGSDLSICLVTMVFGYEHCHHRREGDHADITDDDPDHHDEEKYPEPWIPYISPCPIRECYKEDKCQDISYHRDDRWSEHHEFFRMMIDEWSEPDTTEKVQDHIDPTEYPGHEDGPSLEIEPEGDREPDEHIGKSGDGSIGEDVSEEIFGVHFSSI